ncbi:MAG: RtcB family protein [Candidatus Methanofastidiosa archaeon]|nr:RtcB family protein [Candidatus Methanofastidiosa archaeon]
MNFKRIGDNLWEVPKEGNMKVPVRIVASEELLEMMKMDLTIHQAINVSMLPGIEGASFVMPDGHQGYGFPIGGVAAFNMESGIISPGGVGYDINCGVRLLKTDMDHAELLGKKHSLLVSMFKNVPSGLGSKGKVRLRQGDMDEVLEHGAKWAVENDYGWKEDLKYTEEGGRMPSDPRLISEQAKKRGSSQLGSLGSGNHFLELQYVSEIFDERAAKAFGLYEGQAVVMIHTGSRGCGHQVCSDYLRTMEKALKKYELVLPDRELACAPIASQEGREYFKAMSGAANFAWANRQMITHWTRESFESVYGHSELEMLYDVAHNIAKEEQHKGKRFMVHRKGATRALWKDRPEITPDYKSVGQPVIIPGSMGTASYVLCGHENASEFFGSTAHGAGRVLSRSKAIKRFRGEDVSDDLGKRGIDVVADQMRTVAEEAPEAYKDIDKVADVSHEVGIATKVARLLPLGVVKG